MMTQHESDSTTDTAPVTELAAIEGLDVSAYTLPEAGERVDAFLRDLSEMSRKYKLALSECFMFEMEPHHCAAHYSAADDGVVTFG